MYVAKATDVFVGNEDMQTHPPSVHSSIPVFRHIFFLKVDLVFPQLDFRLVLSQMEAVGIRPV